MFPHRGLLQLVTTLTCYVVLACTFFYPDTHGHSSNGMQNPPASDAYASLTKSCKVDTSDTICSDSSLDNSFRNVCPNSRSFCSPSMLLGSSHKEGSIKETSLGGSGSAYDSPFCIEVAHDSRQASNSSWSSDYGVFRLFNGKFISCSMNSREGVNEIPSLKAQDGHRTGRSDVSSCGGSLCRQKTTHFLSKYSEMSKSSSFEGSVSPNVRIGPTVLDWGQNYIYSSSEAFLTLANTCNDSILHIYEPFSTDLQFYPCNFSEVSLRPGESALICFVFFPRCLGLSLAHLILQTSSGGFIVEAKGYATESPFGIQPLSDLETSPGGGFSKNLSLFNPFDETLYVEEITAWISVSLGHSSVETEAMCNVHDFEAFDTLLFPTIKDRLGVKNSQIGSPMVAIRPHRNWEIGPHSSATLMEMDVTSGFEGKILGAFCLHLLRSSQVKSDTIIVPIEAEVDSNAASDTVGIFVSATLEVLATCDSGDNVITISLKNYAPYALRFIKVLEVVDEKLFHVNYMEGLLLFPGTVTQVGIIYCSQVSLDLNVLPPKFSNLQENCKLLILTNDSTSPLIEVPCEDILYHCFEHQRLSYVGVEDNSKLIKSDNAKAYYVGRSMQLPQDGVVETAAVHELVLGNWKSQGTTGSMSVLEEHEVLFPMIQVGSYVSRWINVKNPSKHPVLMQLVLNSGESIDECRVLDDLFHPSSSGNLALGKGAATPTKHGFSVPGSALTEAYVQPYDRASLGPIIFYPSNRCAWSGSALIRNNLSGVEWISLRGFGGLHSLALLERSDHVQSIDFNVKMLKPLNLSLPYNLLNMKEMASVCSKPLVKELYAKNTGDLPLEVIRIRVSGRECGLDGFHIPSCKGFALEPGESTKLLISYQTDFSADMVHRDLELALATGIFLIPVKATISHDMLSNCKKSMFWMRVKKYLGILLVASLLLLIFCFLFPQTAILDSLDDFCKGDDNLVQTTIKSAMGTSLLHHNQRKSKLSMSGKMNHLVEASCGGYSYDQGNPSELGMSQNLMQTSENNKKTSRLLETQDEGKWSSTTVQGSDTNKAPQLAYLMVNTGKEKGRRKKRKSHGAKLQALSEVSSSQSGNSTPSSPLSPVPSAAPKCNWLLSSNLVQPVEALSSSMTQVAAQHSENNQASSPSSKPEAPLKHCSSSRSSPHAPPSASSCAATSMHVQTTCDATTVVGGSPPSSLVSNSAVTLQSRAPGSKRHNQKDVQAQEEEGLADEYRYDIWGDHFSGFHLLGPKNVTSMKSSPAENNFDSFFVRGPQTLMTNSQEG
ncbi:uncharacterized protein LOC107487780 [Arachis duranensis]|uniref:Uncharacterized protein LOC107487780 n=1 Tax=Arachis duranensis TaxID=130453 RepID=A0A6P4DAL0_ARADU|nr:uncharacterized protein LOC107487780 [Arachis duranensis]